MLWQSKRQGYCSGYHRKIIDFYSRKTSRPLGFEALSELSACGVVSLGKKKGQSHRQSSEIEVDMAILVPSQFLE